MSGPTGAPPARDYCPNCRIAGPHDQNCPRCPRCNGPLTPLDAYGRIARSGPAQRAPITQAERNHTYVPPRASTDAAPRRAPRPSRHVRWVATRPAEARRSGRRRVAAEPTPTPHYDRNPGWGLRDSPADPPAPRKLNYVERMGEVVQSLLLTTAAVLTLAALAQTVLYVLLVVNLETPVSRWVEVVARTAVILTGFVALGFMVACLIGIAGWLMEERRLAYARHDQRDPRPPEQIMLGCWIPVLNLVKPLAFFRELLDRGDDLLPDHTGKRLWWLWAGWLLVNALVVTALGIRVVADTLVWQSNALALVVVSNLVSAVFAVALWWTITRLLAREAPTASPKRFLVAA